jgi:hypothetical protein
MDESNEEGDTTMTRITLLCLILPVILLAACSPASTQPNRAGFGSSTDLYQEAPAAEAPADYDVRDNSSLPGERIVIKDASLEIVVADPGEAQKMISRMAEEMGGYVVASQLRQIQLASGKEVPRGSITIRVPADQLDEALSNIEEQSEEPVTRIVNSQDVTSEYTDLKSRLRNLEAAETQLISIMEKASRTEDVLNVYRQLTNVREEIEVIKGRIQYFDQSRPSLIH